MNTFIWAIDTPWAKKGCGYDDKMKLCYLIYLEEKNISPSSSYVLKSELISLGWIKPVEKNKVVGSERGGNGEVKKKLTAEEIFEAITSYEVISISPEGVLSTSIDKIIDTKKLAQFLAEHRSEFISD